MILIHTALLCEAQTFIEYFKLKKINSTPKIYADDNIIICIAGVGKENTIKALEYIFQNFIIKKAFNIGIAGIFNKDIKIGELFCTTHKLDNILYKKLITVDTPQDNKNCKGDTLYDMEGKYFLQICLQYLLKEDIYIFKIVSDHLDNNILSKDSVKKLICNSKNILNNFIK